MASCFQPAPRKRHERRASTSSIGRGGGAPQYANFLPPHQNNQSRCNLQRHDKQVRQITVGELNSAQKMRSDFEIYKDENSDSSGLKRHQRSASCCLIGRGGCQSTGAYARFGRKHYTREDRLRDEIENALAKRNLGELHKIYARELTELPFENREVRKWRIEVQGYIIAKLKEANTKQELKAAIDMADKQAERFPHTREAKESKAYQSAVDRLAEAVEAPVAKKTVSLNLTEEVKEFSPQRPPRDSKTMFSDVEDSSGIDDIEDSSDEDLVF